MVVVVVVAATAGWWSARLTLIPEGTSSGPRAEPVTATVQQASVGRTVSFSVTVSQPFSLVATNSLTGIVTAVGPGGEVDVGEQLYAVAGHGAYAVAGSTPFYRDLALKDSGQDVVEMQQALVELGFAAPTSGVFDRRTQAAVKAWQKATGQEASGTVPLGTLLAIPQLPGTVRLGEAIVLGAQVAGGEQAVLARTGEPSFALVLSQEQARLVPAGAQVEVRNGDVTWSAVVTSSSMDEHGNTSFALRAADGSIVCGSDCASLPADERLTLLASVHLVPATSGPGAPVAAVRTAADGSTYVLLPDGTQRPVTVKASGDGVAILEGVGIGTLVVVLDAAGTPSSEEGSTAATVSGGDG